MDRVTLALMAQRQGSLSGLLVLVCAAMMMVLEASASNTRDATFKVPVARLRSLRDQIQVLFGLPDTDALCEWTHLYEDVSEVLTAVEVKCAQLPGAEDAEVQILRLKSLLSVVMQWPRYWQHWDDDEYLKVRCGRYVLERRIRQPEEEETLSAAEKYRAVADHLQAMRNIRELPEGTWIHTALAEVQRLQEEESQL